MKKGAGYLTDEQIDELYGAYLDRLVRTGDALQRAYDKSPAATAKSKKEAPCSPFWKFWSR